MAISLKRLLPALLCLIGALSWVPDALAKPTADIVLKLATGENDDKVAALTTLAAANDLENLPLLEALAEDRLKVLNGKQVLIVTDDNAVDAVTGAKLPAIPANLEDVVANNRVRGAVDAAIAALKLASPDREVRLAAIKTLKDQASAEMIPLIERAQKTERDAKIAGLLTTTLASLQLQNPNTSVRIAAIKTLSASGDSEAKQLLMALQEKDGNTFKEPEEAVRIEAQKAINVIDSRLKRGEYAGMLFTGVSLGSILLLAALGLSHHLRADGRDQHGARRADDDRRLRDLSWCRT
jgi:urea transport system permease protein